MVLLAVDVPCAAGGEQRIYLEGGPALYERGGVLGELREPFIRVRRRRRGRVVWGGWVGLADAPASVPLRGAARSSQHRQPLVCRSTRGWSPCAAPSAMPCPQALSMDSAFAAEDEAEEAAEEAERQAAAAARASAAAARAAEQRPKPLDAGGGMYLWERAALWVKRVRAAAQQRQQQAQKPPAQPAATPAATPAAAEGEGGASVARAA